MIQQERLARWAVDHLTDLSQKDLPDSDSDYHQQLEGAQYVLRCMLSIPCPTCQAPTTELTPEFVQCLGCRRVHTLTAII